MCVSPGKIPPGKAAVKKRRASKYAGTRDIINLTRGAIVIQATKRWTRPFAWSLGTQRVRIDRAAPPCTPAAITRPLY